MFASAFPYFEADAELGVIPVSQVIPVRLAHLWVVFRVIIMVAMRIIIYYFQRLEDFLFVSCKEKFRTKTFLQKSFVNFKFHRKVFIFASEDH